MHFVNEAANGRLVLSASSLYGAINSLLKKKWITPFGDDNGRKKNYIITALGQEIARQDAIRLDELLEITHKIMEVDDSCAKNISAILPD